MKKILIINPFGIGDVLFTTPLIRAIKDDNPDNFIGYWCNERVKEIFINNPYVDIVFGLARGDIKKISKRSPLKGIAKSFSLFRKIKKEKFDLALDFSLDYRYALICKIAGIKRRIGFDYKGRGRFLTDKIKIEGYAGQHVVEYYLGLLRFINITPQRKNLELFVSQEYKDKAKQMLSKSGISDKDLIVGIVPGAGSSWGLDSVLKHWPAARFAKLIDEIIEEFKAKVLLLGDGSEISIAKEIRTTMKGEAIDLIGKTSLKELMAIMDNLDMLVTNDGGPLHMASALGIKTVSIFGPVDDAVYGPYPASDKHIVIKTKIDCQPCYRQFRMPDCNRNRECINSISTDEVLTAVRRLL